MQLPQGFRIFFYVQQMLYKGNFVARKNAPTPSWQLFFLVGTTVDIKKSYIEVMVDLDLPRFNNCSFGKHRSC